MFVDAITNCTTVTDLRCKPGGTIAIARVIRLPIIAS